MPRFEKLVAILNTLEISADDVFCDVVEKSMGTHASFLGQQLLRLPEDDKRFLLNIFEFMIKQATERAERSGTLKEVDNLQET